jgi:hypothetical protein
VSEVRWAGSRTRRPGVLGVQNDGSADHCGDGPRHECAAVARPNAACLSERQYFRIGPR